MSHYWPNGTTKRPAIGSKYGPRLGGDSNFHHGTDYIGFTNVHSVADGKVTLAGPYTRNAGITVAVDYPARGENGETITIVYMHLSRVTVRKGSTVKAGDVIGIMGHTGNATGNCVHVEVRYWRGNSFRTVDSNSWIANKIDRDYAPNPASVKGYQRKVVPNASANGRAKPTSKSRRNQSLPANTVGDFDAWTRGEKVGGNDVWFRGRYSGDWFWSGGFTSHSTFGLKKV